MAIKTNENFIPFSNSVTFRKPRGTDLVTASELIPGFCRSKSNVPTPGSLRTIKNPTAGLVPGIKSPPLARTTPPPPHGIYIDRCITGLYASCISWTVCTITHEHLNAFFHFEQKTFKTNTIFLNQKGIITFSFFTNRLVQYQALLNRIYA